jgi:putative ABC transport system permease protein
MSFLSAIRVAFCALLAHKGRSALTSLGIVIGIATVITLVSAGSSAARRMDQIMDGVGKNLILVRARARTQSDFVSSYVELTDADADAMRKEVGHLLVGVAESQVVRRYVGTPSRGRTTQITGTVPDLQRVRNWQVPHGRFLSDDDLKKEAPVCLIGQAVRRDLFPNTQQPVGELLRIDGIEFRIIGILGPKGKLPIGFDQDDQIFVPLTTLQQKLAGEKKLLIITSAARSADVVEPAKAEIQRVLRAQRRLKPGQEDDLDISSVREMSELAFTAAFIMQALVLVIASVSLVVGGIGIMNILLASVAERTREIGLRMAVGATPGAVLVQFLLEGLVLGLVGGLLGILVGLAGSLLLAQLCGWEAAIPPWIVTLAVVVSAGTGLLFSFYPALKASRLEPMAALRCE